MAIRVEGLGKNFDKIQAVQDVSFEVEEGQIVSLLGPNGAGKTTTLSMLACLLRPDSGDAWIMDYSIKTEAAAVKQAIGVVPQEIALYSDLSAKENLQFWGKMYGLRGPKLTGRVEEILELVGLTERQKGPVAKFSGGMKRRLNIGVALLHRPQVLYMDEPTVGIDPQSRRNILDSVKKLNREGMTVLYTTHYMEEAQELSNRIIIMDQGKVIVQGTHQELVKIVGEQDRINLTVSQVVPKEIAERWHALEGVNRVSLNEDNSLTLLVSDSNLILPNLFEVATGLGARITSVDIQEPNLEAVFLHLTGRGLRDS
ncbi:MAG: export ABC transporter ATP-binding protein [Chloroflexi bacterium 54-19]|nr:MAG: export ABC transporter ATP-binding protein [Chloroflexi bacterium 54-19]